MEKIITQLARLEEQGKTLIKQGEWQAKKIESLERGLQDLALKHTALYWKLAGFGIAISLFVALGVEVVKAASK